jgi:hypothetical protein
MRSWTQPYWLALFLTIGLLAPHIAHAGAWVQEPSQGYYRLGGRMVRANQLYGPDGVPTTIPTLSDYSAILYAEYGVLKRLTLIMDIPIFRRLTLNKQVFRESNVVKFSGAQLTGVGDATLGGRFHIASFGQGVLSAGLNFGLPLGEHQDSSGLQTGDGEFDVMPSVLVGYSFYPLPMYTTAFVGVDLRTGKGFSGDAPGEHTLQFTVEAGWTFFERLLLQLRLSGLFPLVDDVSSDPMSGMSFGNNPTLKHITLTPEISYKLTSILGLAAAIDLGLYARNVIAAPAFTLALFATL